MRARQWIKRRNACACPQLLILQCRALAMTPYLAAIDGGARAPAFAATEYHQRIGAAPAQPARSGSVCRPRSGRRRPRAREAMDKEEERVRVPSTADLAQCRALAQTPYLAAIDHAAPSSSVRPEPNITEGNRRSAAQPARSGSRCRPRTGRRRPRAREAMDKEEERVRVPSTADLANAARVGDDPLPRGDRSCAPELQRSPHRISPKRNRRSAAPAGSERVALSTALRAAPPSCARGNG